MWRKVTQAPMKVNRHHSAVTIDHPRVLRTPTTHLCFPVAMPLLSSRSERRFSAAERFA
jgi:hypothetical protein